MTDSLASLCDTFVTNSFPTIQRNIPSKRRNCLAKRHFSQFPFACGFWSHQKNWLSWALHPGWQTEWCQSRVYVRTLQVFCFCLTHLDHFRVCKTKTRGRNFKTTMKTGFHSIWPNKSHQLENKCSINSKTKPACKLQCTFSEETCLVILYSSCRKNYQAFQTMFWDLKSTFSSHHDSAVQLPEKYTIYHT